MLELAGNASKDLKVRTGGCDLESVYIISQPLSKYFLQFLGLSQLCLTCFFVACR